MKKSEWLGNRWREEVERKKSVFWQLCYINELGTPWCPSPRRLVATASVFTFLVTNTSTLPAVSGEM